MESLAELYIKRDESVNRLQQLEDYPKYFTVFGGNAETMKKETSEAVAGISSVMDAKIELQMIKGELF